MSYKQMIKELSKRADLMSIEDLTADENAVRIIIYRLFRLTEAKREKAIRYILGELAYVERS